MNLRKALFSDGGAYEKNGEKALFSDGGAYEKNGELHKHRQPRSYPA